MAAERPFLVLPQAVSRIPPPPTKPPPGGPKNPNKARQIERLGPKFLLLQAAIDERRIALQSDAEGVSPEQVLVFETNGPVAELLDAVRATPGLSWLLDESLADLDPDADFHHVGKDKKPTNKKVSARLYLVMTNQAALEQLLSMWSAWKQGGKRIAGLSPWTKVFARLRDIRRWNVEDRLTETGILEEWNELASWGGAPVPVEIEFWFQSAERRSEAERRVAALVGGAGGQVLKRCVLPEIGYHCVLATISRTSVKTILDSRGVALVHADDVRFFRPLPQMRDRGGPDRASEVHGGLPPPVDLREPVVALLDGLPIENHALLRNRLVVDDPDGFSAQYPVVRRQHGTAMASLILHGDLLAVAPSSNRRLYVRPILKPHPFWQNREWVPRDELWLDLVHRAIKRMYDGDSTGAPAAPNARIINFSIGDDCQPFIHAVSPIARLIDWLSWRYQALFIISAGNQSDPLEVPISTASSAIDERAVLKALHATHRHRRLLAPAEAINAITVGALHEDNANHWKSLSADQLILLQTSGLPSPFSCLGRGFRRSVKPDVLAPGGRAVFNRNPPDGTEQVTFQQAVGPTMPGQQVAAPGKTSGDLSATSFETGSSNAAALTTRLAESIHEVITALQAEHHPSTISDLPPAVLVKALVAHTANWHQPAFDALAGALRTTENAPGFRDMVSAFLGYGQLRPERAISCTEQRATFVTGGFAKPGDLWIHTVPLPSCLHAQSVHRRVTVTLAWLTPINPAHRNYRCVSLSFSAPKGHDSPLGVTGQQVHGNAVSRGTVQHEILERTSGAMDVGVDASLEFPVTCTEDASLLVALPTMGVPYALVVSIEVAPETGLPIYEEVRARIHPPVAITP